MKKNLAVLFIGVIFLLTFSGCKKEYTVVIPVPSPDTVHAYHPDSSFIGNGPFYVKAECSNLILLFNNTYVTDPHAPFYEYKIGDGNWSSQCYQSTPYDGQTYWGSATISVPSSETSLIYVRFGDHMDYADVTSSMFYHNGVICFSLSQITR